MSERFRRGGPIDEVRRFFDLYARGLTEAFLAMLHPQARFAPVSGDGRVCHGPDEVRAYLEELTGDGTSLEPHASRFVSYGDGRVVVVGSLRQRRFRELRDRTSAWVFEVHDGLVHSIEGFASPGEALDAAESRPVGASAPLH